MRQRVRRGDDSGFTMIEVVVALTLFGVLAGTVAASLSAVLNKTRAVQSRTLAADLGARVIDRLHAIPATQLPDGALAPQTFTSDGNVFTVNVATALVAEGAGATDSACAVSGALSAKRISVVVTWSNMGTVRPVRTDTLRQLTVGELDTSKGVITVTVLDRDGAPASGHVVTLNPGARTFTTGTDGCAVFSGLTAGAYVATLGTPGFVDPLGVAAPARSITAVAGTTTKDAGFSYDRAASLAMTYAASPGFPAPAGLGVSLQNSAFTGGVRSFPVCGSVPCLTAGAPGTAGGLYPSAEGYRAWAGHCADATSSGGTAPAATILAPGANGSTTLALSPVRVLTQDKNGVAVKDATVTVTHAADTGCTAGLAVTTAPPAGSNISQLGLPAGTWTFSYVKTGPTQTVTATATIAAGAALTTIALKAL